MISGLGLMIQGKDNRPQSTQRAQSIDAFLCALCGFSNHNKIKVPQLI